MKNYYMELLCFAKFEFGTKVCSSPTTYPALFTCLNSSVETLKKGVKHFQS